jgi:hypothetical protein
MEFSYLLPERVTLPAGARVEIPLFDRQRLEARRMYRLAPSPVSGLQTNQAAPLEHCLVIGNDRLSGLGLILPPGDVHLEEPGQEGGSGRPARISHTLPGNDIRIPLGRSSSVTARMKLLGRTAALNNQYEEVFEVVLQNNLPDPVRVEIEHAPSLKLGWEMVRANAPYHREGQRLVLRPEVGPHREHAVRFRLRIHQPSL